MRGLRDAVNRLWQRVCSVLGDDLHPEVVDSIVSVVIGEPVHGDGEDDDGDDEEEEKEKEKEKKKSDDHNDLKNKSSKDQSINGKLTKKDMTLRAKKDDDNNENEDNEDDDDIMITDEEAMVMMSTDITDSELEELEVRGSVGGNDEVDTMLYYSIL